MDENEIMYRLLSVLLGIGLLYLIPVVFLKKDILYGMAGAIGCPIHVFTGGYCPGCGGTRAVRALFKGDILKSLYYHPLVVYVAVGVTVFWVSHTLKHLTHGRIRGIAMHCSYYYVGIAITVLNCIIKNYYFFAYGISLI